MLRLWLSVVLSVSALFTLAPPLVGSQEQPPPPPVPTRPPDPPVPRPSPPVPRPNTLDPNIRTLPAVPGHPPLDPRRLDEIGRMAPAEAVGLAGILVPTVPPMNEAEAAGLPDGSKPASLTLNQAYDLARIRARTLSVGQFIDPTGHLDATALEQQAQGLGLRDYARFRSDFLAGGFPDPAPGFLEVLRRLHSLEAARWKVAWTENLVRLFEELVQGEATGITQLEIDETNDHRQRSRQEMVDAETAYRLALDEFRASLGLSPNALVILDRGILQPFEVPFMAVESWIRDPNRNLAELRTLHGRLPAPVDVKIGSQSINDVARNGPAEAVLLQSAIEVARTARLDPRERQVSASDRLAQELRIRRLIRELIQSHRNYELQRRRLELAVRLQDHHFEAIVSPPAGVFMRGVAAVTSHSLGLLGARERFHHGRVYLVDLWLDAQARRLALYRELGILPYASWDEFARAFVPEAGRPALDEEAANPFHPDRLENPDGRVRPPTGLPQRLSPGTPPPMPVLPVPPAPPAPRLSPGTPPPTPPPPTPAPPVPRAPAPRPRN